MNDLLLYRRSHTQGVRASDLLPSNNNISSLLKTYIVSGIAEGKSPKTIDRYIYVLSSFNRFITLNSLPEKSEDITTPHISLYLFELQRRKLSPDTVDTHYRSLSTFFNWMVENGFIKKNPMTTIKAPRVPDKLIKPFPHDDIRNLLLLCSNESFIEIRNRAIILMFIDTGLRVSELAGIRLSDIEFIRSTIIVMGKGSKERMVRIGKVTEKALVKYLFTRGKEPGYLWLTEERKPLTSAGIQTNIKRLCKRAGITGVKPGPHTFRHTAAINYLRNGGDIFTLQIMLGHASLKMVRRYLKTLGAEDMIKVHEKVSPVDNLGIK